MANISTVNNQTIVKRIQENNSSQLSQKSRPSQLKESVLQLPNSPSLRQVRSSEIFKNFDQALISDFEKKDQKEKPYEWSPTKEVVFQTYRESSKNALYKNTRSSSWNGIGFSPFIQVSQKEEKNKSQRETKMAKYMNGDPLAPEEFKLIANTSALINAHVDKKFFQFIVNHVEPDTLNAVKYIHPCYLIFSLKLPLQKIS